MLCELSPPAKPVAIEARVVPGKCLSAHQVETWQELQDSNEELANPCFSPEFTQAIAAVRSDVEVALIEQGGGVVAVFPFQRKHGSRAVPVGGIVSDYQGLICRPGFNCEPRELLKACGLVAWDFDRLLSSQICFAPYHKLCEPSAQIDLSEGYQAYAAQRRAAGTRQIQQCEYMMRRLASMFGPLRFVAQSSNEQALEQVMAWKSQQYRRSGWKDLFAAEWGRSLAQRVHTLRSPAFSGMLSLLYAGNHLVAGHLGMRSRTVWHYWFPAYDRKFAKFSPGLILLLKMAQQAEDLGLRCLDLGTGMSLYKRRLMSTAVSVAEGSVERPSCLLLVRSVRRKLSTFLRSEKFTEHFLGVSAQHKSAATILP
jgi:CelD/BcsL family acetyltransferase involved in cellulose biosynthesis